VPGALTFTTTTWDTVQTVTVTALIDPDGAEDTVTLTHDVTGYGDLTAGGEVTVIIPDTDSAPTFDSPAVPDQTYTAGMAIPTLTLPAVMGGDDTPTYTLTGALPDGLTFTAGTRTLTGTPTEVSPAVTLTYTVTDADDNTATSDAAMLTFAITITLDPGVTLSRTALTVDEGAEGTYTVVLTTAPAGDVTVTPTSSDLSAVTVTGALTFSTTTWSMAQTVTVTASTEGNVTTAAITHSVTGYSGVPARGVTVTINRAPDFGMATVPAQTYIRGMAIPTLTLPEATGGNDMLAYALNGVLPTGLNFTEGDRTLTGTPTGAASAVTLTYTATDSDPDTADGDAATLTFALPVVAPTPGGRPLPPAIPVAPAA